MRAASQLPVRQGNAGSVPWRALRCRASCPGAQGRRSRQPLQEDHPGGPPGLPVVAAPMRTSSPASRVGSISVQRGSRRGSGGTGAGSAHTTGGVPPRRRPASPPPVQGAAYASGGCGATPLLLGSAPRWASSANPPPIRYALAKREQIAGFLFGYPLMAGNPQPIPDKVLWVVASPRGGMPLRLTGHPLNAVKPVVSSTWPADSAPGEIYPSEIEVPAPGCWQFTLSWNGHTDTIDLLYVRHR